MQVAPCCPVPRQTPCAQTPLHRPGRHCSAARIVQQGTGGPGRSAAPAQGQQQVNSSRTEINIVVACKEACVLLAGQAVLFKRVHMNCHTCNWRSRSSYKLLLTKQPCLCTLFNNQKLGCILQCIAVSHVTPSQRQPLLHDSQTSAQLACRLTSLLGTNSVSAAAYSDSSAAMPAC